MLLRRHPFETLLQEFNQMQDELARWLGRAGAMFTLPSLPLTVWEDDHNVYAETDLPGVDPAKIEVTVTEGNQLTVQGERTPPEIAGAAWVRQERPFGKFTRVVTLPALVDADKVEARYTDGVLRLTLPKHEAAKPRKVVVKCE